MGVRSVNGQDVTVLLSASAARAPASRPNAAEAIGKAASEVREKSRADEERAVQAASAAQSNPAMQRSGTRLRIDEASKQIVAQIVNKNNEVIKQIPPEEALKIAARFREICGKLFDEKV
jgi:uncharacterized FlaG/YvyC family protein